MKLVLLGFFAVSTPLLLAACEQENNGAEEVMEEVGDEIDDATTN